MLWHYGTVQHLERLPQHDYDLLIYANTSIPPPLSPKTHVQSVCVFCIYFFLSLLLHPWDTHMHVSEGFFFSLIFILFDYNDSPSYIEDFFSLIT